MVPNIRVKESRLDKAVFYTVVYMVKTSILFLYDISNLVLDKLPALNVWQPCFIHLSVSGEETTVLLCINRLKVHVSCRLDRPVFLKLSAAGSILLFIFLILL